MYAHFCMWYSFLLGQLLQETLLCTPPSSSFTFDMHYSHVISISCQSRVSFVEHFIILFLCFALYGAIPWLVSFTVTVFMQMFCKYDIQREC